MKPGNEKFANYLKLHERQKIEELTKQGLSNREIAKYIGRSRNAVDTEIRYAGGPENYNAYKAQISAEKRIDQRRLKLEKSFTEEEIEIVEEALRKGLNMNVIRKQIGCSYWKIAKYFKKMGYDIEGQSDTINNRIIALEQQMQIVLDMMREKND